MIYNIVAIIGISLAIIAPLYILTLLIIALFDTKRWSSTTYGAGASPARLSYNCWRPPCRINTSSAAVKFFNKNNFTIHEFFCCFFLQVCYSVYMNKRNNTLALQSETHNGIRFSLCVCAGCFGTIDTLRETECAVCATPAQASIKEEIRAEEERNERELYALDCAK